MQFTKRQSSVMQIFNLTATSTSQDVLDAAKKPTKAQATQLGLLETLGIDWQAELMAVNDKLLGAAMPASYDFRLSESKKAVGCQRNGKGRLIWMPLELFKAIVEMKEYPESLK